MLVNLILNKEKAKTYNERIKEIKKMHPECAEYMKEVEKLSDVFIPYSQISLGKYVPVEVDYRKDFDGVYICDLNANYDIERLTDYSEVKNFNSPLYWRNYGVCDNASQALDYFDSLSKELEEYTKDKAFVILLVPMIREKEPETDGWRWHKWGPYIGKFEPKCEYLYDEKGIDFIYCFHIYEIKKDYDSFRVF